MGTKEAHKNIMLEMKQTLAKLILLEKGTIKKKDLAKLVLPESQCDRLIAEYNRNPDNDLLSKYQEKSKVAEALHRP